MPSSSDSIPISSSLAAPPTGGACTFILSVSPIIPESPFREDLGSTLIFIETPLFDFVNGITTIVNVTISTGERNGFPKGFTQHYANGIIHEIWHTSRAISIGADFFADSQIQIFKKEAKASEAPVSSGPRMSENTCCPTSLIKIHTL